MLMPFVALRPEATPSQDYRPPGRGLASPTCNARASRFVCAVETFKHGSAEGKATDGSLPLNPVTDLSAQFRSPDIKMFSGFADSQPRRFS